MKRKLSIAGVILVVAIALFALLMHRQDPPILIRGALTEKDITEIKKVVLRENRKHIMAAIFQKPSVSQMKRIPRYVRACLQLRLESVEVLSDTEVRVFCTTQSDHLYTAFFLSKGTNGWSIDKGGHFYQSEQLLRP